MPGKGFSIFPPSLSGGSGDVVGPASATDGHLALFDGTTGKLIKDGGAPGGGGSDWDVEVVKSADEDVVASIIQIADSELTCAVATGETWLIELLIKYSGDAAGTDLRCNALFPTANGQYTVTYISTANAATHTVVRVAAAGSLTTVSAGTGAGLTVFEALRFEILLSVTGASGAFVFTHANQNSGTTRVAAGSILRGRKLAP